MKFFFGVLIILALGLLAYFILVKTTVNGRKISIQDYAVDKNGLVRLTVNSDTGNYYMLRVRHHPDAPFFFTSMTLGRSGKTIITESLRAYPPDQYEVFEYSINDPQDADGDSLNDMLEYMEMPFKSPFNAATPLPEKHALLSLNTLAAFEKVSTHENKTILPYLNNLEYTKFLILDFYSDKPQVYFINCNTYNLHVEFTDYLHEKLMEPDVIKGQLMKDPVVLSGNGTLGTYAFNFANNEAPGFKIVQRTQELLAANMPYLANNLSYFITQNNEQDYQQHFSSYKNSRIPVLFESDVYAGINYWGLNQTEGYGFFHIVPPGQLPGSRDIVLYEELPNSLPRVGGIITSAVQTPLSHINLRAIHDQVPNAFIRNPLKVKAISDLLDHYVYFKTDQSNYEIREATLEEVSKWYDKSRPKSVQSPPLNLSYKSILPLGDVTFRMYDGFGAKAANVAAMRSFGFPEGTIPDGFAIPFYFYLEFMRHNNFFAEIENMLHDPDFISNRSVRNNRLKKLRSDIKNATLPDWMMAQLVKMQNSFPRGTSIRCRSSTNNEDLPGFSGAGLYDSKTHRPNEGHISKTIKQIYASLWNLRAFEEREFYRVNHLYTAMGVLCHPNFDNEKVNGVGISEDPVYNTQNTFYLNSQLGEQLITNPKRAFPEELLINRNLKGAKDYSVIQYSNLLTVDSLLMTDIQIGLIRRYLSVIHDRFATLYKAENNPTFAMDVEYKIDRNNRLIIKQARPWVSYIPAK